MRKRVRRYIAYTALALSLAVLLGSALGFMLALTHELPQIEGLETFQPAAITRIYSADKELLAERFTEKRQPVPLHVMPRHLKEAILSTEDAKFYDHPGVDVKGILRAIVRNILAGEYAEGASTITQQLAKTLFLTPRKTMMRKIKEAFLAFQIERRYTKDEILELYLNQVYFGSGAYGVEAAAQIFFGKTVADLTLAESALIAGMPKSPSRYSPLVNRTLARKRRNVVLHQMFTNQVITESQWKAAKTAEVDLAPRRERLEKAPYFVAHTTRLLEKVLGETALYKQGLSIYTTLNYDMQQAAENAVNRGLKDLAARMADRGLSGSLPQAALVCLDVKRGGILALVGGRDYEKSPFDRATMALRQPGSAFKPLVYALAVEKGFSQNDMIWDAPVAYKGAVAGKDWTPTNFSKKYMGEITLRTALALSKNIPAVRLLNKLGPVPAVEFAHKMGITTPLAPNLSLVLGTSEVTLLELTSAYAAFPRGGIWIKPYGVTEVLDRQERKVWRQAPVKQPVMSPETAAVMTDLLTAVIQEGTGRRALSLDRPLAGKTGTTDQFRDALFVGFSPSIALGVWVGLDNHETMGQNETGARAALPIWMDFMAKVLPDLPYEDFDLPAGVLEVKMDAASGLLAAPGCPNGVTAVFRKGHEPSRYCKHGTQGPWETLH